MVYGPRDTEVLKVFKLVRSGLTRCSEMGRQELSAVTGPDLAQAMLLTATSAATVGKTYYACHPEVFTSEQFAHAVAAAMHREVRVIKLPNWLAVVALGATGAWAWATHKANHPDSGQGQRILPAGLDRRPHRADARYRAGYQPRTWRLGLANTAQWYREAGWI